MLLRHAALFSIVTLGGLIALAPTARGASHATMEAGPAKPPLPAIESLQLEPPALTLENARDGRLVLVWGVAKDGLRYDLTDDATFKPDSASLTIGDDRYIAP